MSTKKEKIYARLDTAYRDLLVPVDLLERVVAECHLVRTTYLDGSIILAVLSHSQSSRSLLRLTWMQVSYKQN